MAQARDSIAVLGGGICGLAAAYWLRKAVPDADIVVHEAASRCGGVIGTFRAGDLLLETGPLAFPASAPATAELLKEAGATDLIRSAPGAGSAGILRGNRVVPLARTPSGILRARLLSARALLRLLAEPFIPASLEEDESVGAFFRRRTGAAFLDEVMDPLVAAIQAGDPAALGMDANFPEWRRWERSIGRLAMGLWRQERQRPRGAVAGALAAGPRGNGPIVDALAESLLRSGVRIRLRAGVEAILPHPEGGFTVRSGFGVERFGAVVSCLRAPDLARVFPAAPEAARGFLAAVPYASVALAYLAYGKRQLQGGFAGAHCLVPATARAGVLSLSIPSRMAPGRCPDDRECVRVSLGGMRDPEAATLPDPELRKRAARAVDRILAPSGFDEGFACVRQPASLPQLGVGHMQRLRLAREGLQRALPGFILSGTATCGAGIERAAQEGKRAALELAARLGAP